MTIFSWWVFLFISILGFSFCSMYHAYFPFDKTSREKVRKFISIKGNSYLILAIATFIELIIGNSNLIVPCLTIFIAIMEGIQNIIQSKADRFNETAREKLEHSAKNQNFLREVEKLYIYCYEQIKRLEVGQNPDLEQLVFEKVYDCLKYYTIANKFISTFNNYRKKQCAYEELEKALDEWKEEFQYLGEEIVKKPENEI